MMPKRRLALLVGSTIPIDDSMKPIPLRIRDANLEIMTEALDSHGDFSFGWPIEKDNFSLTPKLLRNPTRAQLINVISQVEPHGDDLFLFYYFGHGFVGDGGELVLAYKNLDMSRDTSLFSLNEAIREVVARGFTRLIIILDCCHAGLSSPGLKVVAKNASYYLMASTGGGRSYFDVNGGGFSRALKDALTYSNAEALRDVQRNAATFERWFGVARGLVSPQVPTSDGTLGGEVFFPNKVTLTPSVNRLAPTKSLYNKIYLLLDIVGVAVLSLDEIYKRVKDRELYSFRIATAAEDGQVVERFVLPEKVREYLNLLTDLGLTLKQKDTAKNETLWNLTTHGSRAVANEGALFNKELVDAIFRWLPEGVTADVINSILFELASKAVLPKVLYVEQSLIARDLPILRRRDLRVVLQLLTYAGVIQRATSDTFFPR